MKSVKGLTWGTPKFVEIAKAAEREGEARYEIDRMLGEFELMEIPQEVYGEARAYAATIFELCGGECGW